MDQNEKILLLEITLRDICSSWGSCKERLLLAKTLSKELGFVAHIERIDRFIENIPKGFADGREFRCSSERAGYDGLEILHNLDYNYNNKSDEFKDIVENVIINPEIFFEDLI